MANKRKYRRFIRRCETEFSSGGETYRGISSDFSVAGMFIRTKKPLPPDTLLDIKVHLPDASVANLSGLVRRAAQHSVGRVMYAAGSIVQKSGMGVELVEKDANYLDFLRSFLAEEELSAESAGEAVAEGGETEEGEAEEEASLEEEPEREQVGISEMLIHLITSQQALINLLDKQGVIDKRDIAQEMAKLRKR